MTEGHVINDRYIIREKVGAGGMADVYRATDTRTNTDVAVKQLHTDLLNDPEFVRRFEREARAQSMLNHPNIVKTLDHGTDGNVPYIVMEYVEGITLKDFIKNRAPIPQNILTRIARQILSALEHAHAYGVVHRDIKPQNVLMGRGNVLKVTDFGLAKAASSATITMTGSNVLGSVHYFSPEQARGIASDSRSDLYSLGIVMYEMATGVLPYQGDTPVTVALKHLQEVPYWPHLYADVQPGLESVILKAILKDPDQRYQTAAEMMRDLDRALQHPEYPVVRFPENLYIAMDADEGDGPARPVVRRESASSQVQRNAGSRVQNQTPHVVPVSRDTENRYTPKRRTSRNGRELRMILIFTSAAIVIALAVILFVVLATNRNRLVMPDFTDYTQTQVENLLTEYEIAYTFEYEYNDEVDSGRVIRQTPDAETKLVRNETEAVITISLGSEELEMPSLLGHSYDTALELLLQNDLVLSSVEYKVDASKAKDTVVMQQPQAGDTVKRGEQVIIWLARP